MVVGWALLFLCECNPAGSLTGLGAQWDVVSFVTALLNGDPSGAKGLWDLSKEPFGGLLPTSVFQHPPVCSPVCCLVHSRGNSYA